MTDTWDCPRLTELLSQIPFGDAVSEEPVAPFTEFPLGEDQTDCMGPAETRQAPWPP